MPNVIRVGVYWDLWGRSCGILDTETVFVIMSIAHAQCIFMPMNVRPVYCLCHMLDPAVSSLVYGLVYVTHAGAKECFTAYCFLYGKESTTSLPLCLKMS